MTVDGAVPVETSIEYRSQFRRFSDIGGAAHQMTDLVGILFVDAVEGNPRISLFRASRRQTLVRRIGRYIFALKHALFRR